jgi:putative tryptophan/tyrosine transport system substrate-binding protein
MQRRDFITLLGGAAAAWPLVAHAQRSDRIRLIGVLINLTEDDPQVRVRTAAFRQELEKSGWIEGHNFRIEYRFAAGIAGREEALAKELVALQPDLILAHGYTTAALHRATLSIPIVFVFVAEPVAQGFVESLAHPGGNITGFTFLEPSVAAKWVGLLKEIAPHVTRIIFMLNPDTTSVPLEFSRSAEDAAQKFGMQILMTPVHTPAEIEALMTALGREPGAGLVLTADTFTTVHRKLIIELAARNRLPLITGNAPFPKEGGLMYYGADPVDLYRRAAAYVDRILRGEKPADLPVQAPTKFELVINLKTAKALALTIPPALLATADEVIE